MYQWDDRYCIGEPVIDSQHQKLFHICERIMKILQYEDEVRSRRAAAEAVKYLKNYTIEHFAHEEAYQQAIGYREFVQHRQKHEAFKQTILEEEKILEESEYSSENVEQFVKIVNDWLVDHIIQSDQAITPGK